MTSIFTARPDVGLIVIKFYIGGQCTNLLKVTFVFPPSCDVVIALKVFDRFFQNLVWETQYSDIIKSPEVFFMKTINKRLYVYYELLIRCYEHTACKTNKLQRMFGGIVCVVLQNRVRPSQFC